MEHVKGKMVGISGDKGFLPGLCSVQGEGVGFSFVRKAGISSAWGWSLGGRATMCFFVATRQEDSCYAKCCLWGKVFFFWLLIFLFYFREGVIQGVEEPCFSVAGHCRSL